MEVFRVEDGGFSSPLALSRDFTVITLIYKLLKVTQRDFSMLKHNCKILLCFRNLPKDFLLKDNFKRLPLLKHNYLRLYPSQSQLIVTS